ALLLAALALPLLGGLAAAALGRRDADGAGRAGTAAGGLGFLLAAALAVAVLAGGPVSATVDTAAGEALAGFALDRVGAVLLLLVLGVGAVVQAFARRYLRGDVRAPRFFALAGALTGTTAAMVTAATLPGLALAWTLAGVALCALLGLYRGHPAAEEGRRRAARAFALGDGALWLATGIALATWGNLDLRALDAERLAASDPAALTAVACLLVVAALARSAQLPLPSWLPATLAAPTPVSALLHAGVINAGGVLLVKLSPIFGASTTATHLAFAAGAATAVHGTALMLAKPDVKGALAHSTAAQMGFMVMTCGLGAYAAAVFHLVAHGMYKATLFLGSGAAVGRHVRHVKAPPRAPMTTRTRAAAAVAAVALPALALAGAAWALGPKAGAGALLIFGWASGARLAWGWLTRRPSAAAVLVVAGAAAPAAFAYVAALRATGELLAPALTAAGDASVAVWGLAPVLALLGLVALRERLGGLNATLYAWALAAGHATRPRARAAARAPRRAPLRLSGALVARTAGSRP
ncbi:MAG TPA: proton-conducting transporter membrane subunit, partial [Solirubrobacteraceae bacterium]